MNSIHLLILLLLQTTTAHISCSECKIIAADISKIPFCSSSTNWLGSKGKQRNALEIAAEATMQSHHGDVVHTSNVHTNNQDNKNTNSKKSKILFSSSSETYLKKNKKNRKREGVSHGICNHDTGRCNCKPSYSGMDCCSVNLPCCQTCSEHGTCDGTTGECTCHQGYGSGDGSECCILIFNVFLLFE